MNEISRVIRLNFPCQIQQCGESQVEIRLPYSDKPLIPIASIDAIAPELSSAEKDKLSDDAHEWLLTQAIIRSIKIGG